MDLDTSSSASDAFSDTSSIGVDGTLNPSRLLQDALAHIDGLIENERRNSTIGIDSKLLSMCTDLRVHIEELKQLKCEHDSDIPEDTVKVIYEWAKRQLGMQVSEFLYGGPTFVEATCRWECLYST